MERTGLLQLGGKDVTVIGPDIEVGQKAPEFTVHDHDWNQVNALESTQGKVRIIASLPSLDQPFFFNGAIQGRDRVAVGVGGGMAQKIRDTGLQRFGDMML